MNAQIDNQEVRPRRFQRWIGRALGRPSYRVMEWDSWRTNNKCVHETIGWEFLCGVHSVHLARMLGVCFEFSNMGGMAQHYGYHAKTWLLLFSFNRKTFRIGVGNGRRETRLYDAAEEVQS